MAQKQSMLAQRSIWTSAVAVLAALFWLVALGVGLRGWFLVSDDPIDRGIVAHAHGFGQDAAPYMITAAILTLTTAAMGIGTALIRHMVDSGVDTDEPRPELEPAPGEQLPAVVEVDEDDASGGADTDADRSVRSGAGRSGASAKGAGDPVDRTT